MNQPRALFVFLFISNYQKEYIIRILSQIIGAIGEYADHQATITTAYQFKVTFFQSGIFNILTFQFHQKNSIRIKEARKKIKKFSSFCKNIVLQQRRRYRFEKAFNKIKTGCTHNHMNRKTDDQKNKQKMGQLRPLFCFFGHFKQTIQFLKLNV